MERLEEMLRQVLEKQEELMQQMRALREEVQTRQAQQEQQVARERVYSEKAPLTRKRAAELQLFPSWVRYVVYMCCQNCRQSADYCAHMPTKRLPASPSAAAAATSAAAAAAAADDGRICLYTLVERVCSTPRVSSSTGRDVAQKLLQEKYGAAKNRAQRLEVAKATDEFCQLEQSWTERMLQEAEHNNQARTPAFGHNLQRLASTVVQDSLRSHTAQWRAAHPNEPRKRSGRPKTAAAE